MSNIQIKRALAKSKLKLKFNELKESKELLYAVVDSVEDQSDLDLILKQGEEISAAVDQQEALQLQKIKAQENNLQKVVKNLFRDAPTMRDMSQTIKLCCQFLIGRFYIGYNETLCSYQIFDLDAGVVVLTGTNYTYHYVKYVIDERWLAVYGLYNNTVVDLIDLETLAPATGFTVEGKVTKQLVASSPKYMLFGQGEEYVLVTRDSMQVQCRIKGCKTHYFNAMSDHVVLFFDVNTNKLKMYNIFARAFTLNYQFAKINMIKQCGPQATALCEDSNRVLVYQENLNALYDLTVLDLNTFSLVKQYNACAVLTANPYYFIIQEPETEYKVVRSLDLKEVLKTVPSDKLHKLTEVYIDHEFSNVVLYGEANKFLLIYKNTFNEDCEQDQELQSSMCTLDQNEDNDSLKSLIINNKTNMNHSLVMSVKNDTVGVKTDSVSVYSHEEDEESMSNMGGLFD